MNKKIVINIGVVFLLVIGIICLYELVLTDHEGPAIRFSNEELIYVEGQDEAVLLEDVTAKDKKDGDVTDTLIVTKKVILSGGVMMKVEYAAKDGSNNITTKERVIGYQPSEAVSSPSSEEEKEKDSQNTDDATDGAEHTDTDSTGETTTSLEETTGSVQNSNENPTGDIDREAANATGIPVIKLNATEATITEGEVFDAISYVKETYDNSGDVSRRIRIIGEENINGVGDYELFYSVSDTEGNVSEPIRFLLHVVAAAGQGGENLVNQ